MVHNEYTQHLASCSETWHSVTALDIGQTALKTATNSAEVPNVGRTINDIKCTCHHSSHLTSENIKQTLFCCLVSFLIHVSGILMTTASDQGPEYGVHLDWLHFSWAKMQEHS